MKKILAAKGLGIWLLVVTISGLLVLIISTSYTGYRSSIKESEEGTLYKLQSIANTLSLQVNGNELDELINRYNTKDTIKESNQDSIYYSIHQKLKAAKIINAISTDIYILKYDSLTDHKGLTPLFFTVVSGDVPYYFHPYSTAPIELKLKYNNGGMMSPFEDEHGHWLSAIAPVKNSMGKTVGVIEVDQQFDEFIKLAKGKAFDELLVLIIIFIVITSIITFLIIKIIKIDNANREKIIKTNSELQSKNLKISESINYAQRIQSALLPDSATIKEALKDSFVFYLAKDVISGDFPWFFQKCNNTYISAVDCTGHGVPGAMMSFVGYFLLNEISAHIEEHNPGYILDKLDEKVKETLKQNDDSSNSRDGMDIALCSINLTNNIVEFAGAHRPLFLVRNNEIVEYKGERKGIGGLTLKNHPKSFTNHKIDVQVGDCIYMFSDGLPDQFGGKGETKKKYSLSRIKELIMQYPTVPMEKMKEIFEKDFIEWKGSNRQMDDILLIGIRF